jgi:hypothetical protein
LRDIIKGIVDCKKMSYLSKEGLLEVFNIMAYMMNRGAFTCTTVKI